MNYFEYYTTARRHQGLDRQITRKALSNFWGPLLILSSRSEKMEVQTYHQSEQKEQDVDQDDPQSSPEIQIICVRSSIIGGRYAIAMRYSPDLIAAQDAVVVAVKGLIR